MHIIRGGLNYNMELRWDGVRSLADAMAMLKEQVGRTPPPQWVRVVGGFTEHQFAEKRLPTLDEINAAAPDTPVFILHLYDRALLNRAALRAVGYTKDTPEPAGRRDPARRAAASRRACCSPSPTRTILYATLAKGPKLPPEYQKNSTRHFMREMNRLGVTGVIDAGGGFQNYPDDYAIIEELHRDGQLTVRIAYNLFTQKPKAGARRTSRLGQAWSGRARATISTATTAPARCWSTPPPTSRTSASSGPDMPPDMEGDLEPVVRLLAENRWPFRLHATYDETIARALDVFEKVNRDVPLDGLHWFFDHAETITDRNIERIARLGGGIAVQHRMAYQGEYFVERYGAEAAERTPPIATHAGSWACRSAPAPTPPASPPTIPGSRCPGWSPAGRVGGTDALSARPTGSTARRRCGSGPRRNTWFSNEAGKKGQIKAGQLADLAVLDRRLSSPCPRTRSPDITSVLTLLGGKAVHGDGEFRAWPRRCRPPMPDWSPVRPLRRLPARARMAPSARRTPWRRPAAARSACGVHGHDHGPARAAAPVRDEDLSGFWGALGCRAGRSEPMSQALTSPGRRRYPSLGLGAAARRHFPGAVAGDVAPTSAPGCTMSVPPG